MGERCYFPITLLQAALDMHCTMNSLPSAAQGWLLLQVTAVQVAMLMLELMQAPLLVLVQLVQLLLQVLLLVGRLQLP
jgi:hypothetical protein